MCLEETCPKLLKAPSSQPVDLPFQKGTPIDPSGSKQDQELQDLYREILMVRISELHELDNDSMERLNLDDYNSDDYDKYLSDNMETTPPIVTEVEATRPACSSSSRYSNCSTGGAASCGGSLRASPAQPEKGI